MISMAAIWYLLKVLFMFSPSIPMIYVVMYLEDERKALIHRNYIRECGYKELRGWEALLEQQSIIQKRL